MQPGDSFRRGQKFYHVWLAGQVTSLVPVDKFCARAQFLAGVRFEAQQRGERLFVSCLPREYRIYKNCVPMTPACYADLPDRVTQVGHSYEFPTFKGETVKQDGRYVERPFNEYSEAWQAGYAKGVYLLAELKASGMHGNMIDLDDFRPDFRWGIRHAVAEVDIPARVEFVEIDDTQRELVGITRYSLEEWYEERAR